MKLHQTALAVLAMAAAPAFALSPTGAIGATELWMTGASANQGAVLQGFLSLCKGATHKNAAGAVITNPGTFDASFYQVAATQYPGNVGSNDQAAYACTIGTDDGRALSLEGTKVVLYHTVAGGSFNAYSPALKLAGDTNSNLPASLARIKQVTDLTTGCAAATTQTIAISGQNNTVNAYRSCPVTTVTLATPSVAASVNVAGDTAPTQSIGGFSDTEYMLNKLNLGVATDVSAIGTTEPANLAQVFAVAVSYPLYAKLQADQGIITATPSCAGNYTSLACQPNLPAAAYTSVVNVGNKDFMSAAAFGGTGKLNLVRRTPTSGTQSASNAFFLGKPCVAGDAGGALEPTRVGTYNAGNFVVTEQSGTSGVKTALNTATGAGEYAIGVMSAENTPSPTATADRWAFVKLNGVSPNLADSFQRQTAIDGSYTMWYEMELFKAATAPQEGLDVLSAINASLANPEQTNLKGLFLTALSGQTGSNVSAFYKAGNSCSMAQR